MPDDQAPARPPARKDDFDPTAELWDRLAEDIAVKGTPCLATVEKLGDEACRLSRKKPASD